MKKILIILLLLSFQVFSQEYEIAWEKDIGGSFAQFSKDGEYIYVAKGNTINKINYQFSPNPAGDYIIVIHAGLDAESIEIYNIFGESVTTTPPSGHPFELEGEKIRIDISNLAPGVYFVRIGDRFEKFIKI